MSLGLECQHTSTPRQKQTLVPWIFLWWCHTEAAHHPDDNRGDRRGGSRDEGRESSWKAAFKPEVPKSVFKNRSLNPPWATFTQSCILSLLKLFFILKQDLTKSLNCSASEACGTMSYFKLVSIFFSVLRFKWGHENWANLTGEV